MVRGAQDILESPDEPGPVSANDNDPVVVQEGVNTGSGDRDEDQGDRDDEAVVRDADEKDIATQSAVEDVAQPVVEDSNDFSEPPSSPIVLEPVEEVPTIDSSEQQADLSTEIAQVIREGDQHGSEHTLEQDIESPSVPQVESGTLEEQSANQSEGILKDEALPEEQIPENTEPDKVQPEPSLHQDEIVSNPDEQPAAVSEQQRPLTPNIIEDSQIESNTEFSPASTESKLPEPIIVAPSSPGQNTEEPAVVEQSTIDATTVEQPSVEAPVHDHSTVEQADDTGHQPDAQLPEEIAIVQQEQADKDLSPELSHENPPDVEPSAQDQAGSEGEPVIDETTLGESHSPEEPKDPGESRPDLENLEDPQVTDTVDSEQPSGSDDAQPEIELEQGDQEDTVSPEEPSDLSPVEEHVQSSSGSANVAPDAPLDQVEEKLEDQLSQGDVEKSSEEAAVSSPNPDQSDDTVPAITPLDDSPGDAIDTQEDSHPAEAAEASDEVPADDTIDTVDGLDRDSLGLPAEEESSKIEQDAPEASLESSDVLPVADTSTVEETLHSGDAPTQEETHQEPDNETIDNLVVPSNTSVEELSPSPLEQEPAIGDMSEPQPDTAANEDVANEGVANEGVANEGVVSEDVVSEEIASEQPVTSEHVEDTVEEPQLPISTSQDEPSAEGQAPNIDSEQVKGQDDSTEDEEGIANEALPPPVEASVNEDEPVTKELEVLPETVAPADEPADMSLSKDDLETSTTAPEDTTVVASEEQDNNISEATGVDAQPDVSSEVVVDHSANEVDTVTEPTLPVSSSENASAQASPEPPSSGQDEAVSRELENDETLSPPEVQPHDDAELSKEPGDGVGEELVQQDGIAIPEQQNAESAVEVQENEPPEGQETLAEPITDAASSKGEDPALEGATEDPASKDISEQDQMPVEPDEEPVIAEETSAEPTSGADVVTDASSPEESEIPTEDALPTVEDHGPDSTEQSGPPAEVSEDDSQLKEAGIAAVTAAAAGVAVHELVSSKETEGDDQVAVPQSADEVERPKTADKATGTPEATTPDQNDLEVRSISSAAPDSPEEVSSQQPLSESFTMVDPRLSSDQDRSVADSTEKPVLLSRVDSSTQTDELWRPKTPLARSSTPGIVLPDPNDEDTKGMNRARSVRRMSKQSVKQAEEVVAAAVIIRAAADTLGETSDRMASHVKDLKQHGETTAPATLQVDGRGTRVADTSTPYDFIANPTTGKESSKADDKLPRSPRSREHRASHSSRSSRPSTREDGTVRSSHHRHSSHRHRPDGERDAEQSPRTPPRRQDTAESAQGSHSSRSRRERTPQEQAEHERRKEERRREREKAKAESPVAEAKGKEVEAPPSADRSHRSSRRHSSTRHSVTSPSNTSKTESSAPAPSKKFFDMKNGESVMGSNFGGPLTADTASTSTKDKDTVSSSRRSKDVTRPPPVELKRSSTTRSSKGIRRSLDQSHAKLQKAREQESTKAAKESHPRGDSSSPGPGASAETKKSKEDDKHRRSRLEKREKEEKDEKKKSGGLKGMFKRLFSN